MLFVYYFYLNDIPTYFMLLKINYSLLKVKANKLTKSQSLNFDKSAAVAVNF